MHLLLNRLKKIIQLAINRTLEDFQFTFLEHTNCKFQIFHSTRLIKDYRFRAVVSARDIYPYEKFKDQFGIKRKMKNFNKGMLELESQLQATETKASKQQDEDDDEDGDRDRDDDNENDDHDDKNRTEDLSDVEKNVKLLNSLNNEITQCHNESPKTLEENADSNSSDDSIKNRQVRKDSRSTKFLKKRTTLNDTRSNRSLSNIDNSIDWNGGVDKGKIKSLKSRPSSSSFSRSNVKKPKLINDEDSEVEVSESSRISSEEENQDSLKTFKPSEDDQSENSINENNSTLIKINSDQSSQEDFKADRESLDNISQISSKEGERDDSKTVKNSNQPQIDRILAIETKWKNFFKDKYNLNPADFDKLKRKLLDERMTLKLEAKAKEKERLKKEKMERKRLEKLRQLLMKPENPKIIKAVVIVIDQNIKNSLSKNNANIDKCLGTMDIIEGIQISSKNLSFLGDCLKELIQTLKKCRKYKGDERVRQKADLHLNRLKKFFADHQVSFVHQLN